MNINELIVGLPGEDLVRRGLADHQAGRCTAESFLVQISRPRMVDCGLLSPDKSAGVAQPELELYRLLQSEGGDAYARYNALSREIVSFGMALDRRVREAQTAGSADFGKVDARKLASILRPWLSCFPSNALCPWLHWRRRS